MFCSGSAVAYLRANPPPLAFNSRQMLRLMTRTSHRRLDHLRLYGLHRCPLPRTPLVC
jgi:hypothetical protein